LDFSLLCLATIGRLFAFIETAHAAEACSPRIGVTQTSALLATHGQAQSCWRKSLNPLVRRHLTLTDSRHVLFVFPNGGLRVSPGQVYSIRLSGGSVFGWKYVVGGYANGAASFNGKPLLPDTRITFLFRTFGAS